ncbi:hypothetical protein [Streptomyces sp. NBC_00525]|uniref:hypothetical protein n=1 Tax=Streptomyces sp. NBC_00525 TaxID=2903660 RepID=UPI002E7FBCBE|nr:hypothetical protein [Streptomyces sp. NBC_00525]WUC93736.1 hypothetical protein OG710_09010 [Streptomyces sp. NBC_00525]
MSDNEAVTPSGIPVFTGNLALLDTSVTTLTKSAASTATAAGDVHSSFGGLQAFYKAPEADQLFATTQPVADRGTSLKSELETITAALSAYTTDAAPLVEKLRELKREAESFVVRIKDDNKWREDGDLVEENNRRHDEIAETWAAFQAVERACHDKIVALVGGPALKTDDGSGKKGTYGYDAETLKHAEGLPWGDPVEESKPWWHLHEHAWDFAKGFFVDGVWGTIEGLGTLVGTDGWDSAKQAWSGLGKLATGVVITATPLAGLYWGLPDDQLPAYLRDSRKAMKETGKALLAWDQWSENPSRALGAVAFNVVTTVFTGGTGGAASGAGKAAVAAKALSTAGKVGRVVDPMTYVFKGAGMGLTKIGDGLAALKGLGQLEIPTFPEGTVALPEGAFKLPDGTLHLPEGAAVPAAAFEVPANSFKLPDGAKVPSGAIDLGDGVVRLPEGVHPPEGALRVPEGALKLPDGTTALPENVIKGVDEHGNTVYLDRPGNVLAEDGTLLQHNSAARQEGAGARASASPEEALTGATTRTSQTTHFAGRGAGGSGHSLPEPPSGAVNNAARGSGPGSPHYEHPADATNRPEGPDDPPHEPKQDDRAGASDSGGEGPPHDHPATAPRLEGEQSRPRLALPPSDGPLTLRDVRNTGRTRDRWERGEEFHRQLWGGDAERHYPVPTSSHPRYPVTATGGRKVDVPVDLPDGRTLAVEVKTYGPYRTITLKDGTRQSVRNQVPLSQHIREQIHKDLALRRADPRYDPRWSFTHAGPSDELRAYLTEARIIFLEYGEAPKKN